MIVGVFATKAKDYLGSIIAIIYVVTIAVSYIYHDKALTAIFATPLVFLVAWYIIKPQFKTKINVTQENIHIQNIDQQTIKRQTEEK